MFQYRQILLRLRQGDTDRQIARSGLVGRRKIAAFRALCRNHGWLDTAVALPEDTTVADAVGSARTASYSTASPSAHRVLLRLGPRHGLPRTGEARSLETHADARL